MSHGMAEDIPSVYSGVLVVWPAIRNVDVALAKLMWIY